VIQYCLCIEIVNSEVLIIVFNNIGFKIDLNDKLKIWLNMLDMHVLYNVILINVQVVYHATIRMIKYKILTWQKQKEKSM